MWCCHGCYLTLAKYQPAQTVTCCDAQLGWDATDQRWYCTGGRGEVYVAYRPDKSNHRLDPTITVCSIWWIWSHGGQQLVAGHPSDMRGFIKPEIFNSTPVHKVYIALFVCQHFHCYFYEIPVIQLATRYFLECTLCFHIEKYNNYQWHRKLSHRNSESKRRYYPYQWTQVVSSYQRRGLRLGEDGCCLHEDGLHLLEPDWLRAAREHLHLPPSSADSVLGLYKYVCVGTYLLSI